MCTSYKTFFKDREYLLTFLTLMSVMLLSLKRHLCWSFVIGFYSQCMCWNGVFVTICTCTACPIRTKKIQPTLHTKRKLIWSCIKKSIRSKTNLCYLSCNKQNGLNLISLMERRLFRNHIWFLLYSFIIFEKWKKGKACGQITKFNFWSLLAAFWYLLLKISSGNRVHQIQCKQTVKTY